MVKIATADMNPRKNGRPSIEHEVGCIDLPKLRGLVFTALQNAHDNGYKEFALHAAVNCVIIDMRDCDAEIQKLEPTDAQLIDLIQAWRKTQAPGDNGWFPINTVPLDPETPVLLLTRSGQTEARYCPGEWSEHYEFGREYSGAVWSCCDDEWSIEIEENGPDQADWHHGIATHWRPLLELPKGAAK